MGGGNRRQAGVQGWNPAGRRVSAPVMRVSANRVKSFFSLVFDLLREKRGAIIVYKGSKNIKLIYGTGHNSDADVCGTSIIKKGGY